MMTNKFYDGQGEMDFVPIPDGRVDKFEMTGIEQYVDQSFDGDFTAKVKEAEYLDRLNDQEFTPKDKLVMGNNMFSTSPGSNQQSISRASRGRGMSPIFVHEIEIVDLYPPRDPETKFGD